MTRPGAPAEATGVAPAVAGEVRRPKEAVLTFARLRNFAALVVFAAPALARPPAPVPPSPGTSTPVELPATPVGRRAAAFIDAFNSGDEERVRRFYEESFTTESLRERPADVRLGVFRNMKKANGHFRVDRVV